jgi:hypothetical protein
MTRHQLHPKRRIFRTAVAAAAASGLAAVFLPALGAPPGPAAAVEVPPYPWDGTARVVDLVKTLVVREEEPPPFDPAQFEHWIDADGDGCDTRQEVLIATSHPQYLAVGPQCQVSGEWHSYYEGGYLEDPAQLAIDHLVPLEEAWRSGAWEWTPEQRRDFANDLDYMQASLLPITLSVHEAKGSSDPAEWLPPYHGTHCGYVQKWVLVKSRWNLTVDPQEYRALEEMLNAGSCTQTEKVPPRGLHPGRGPATLMGDAASQAPLMFLATAQAITPDGTIAAEVPLEPDGTYILTGLSPGDYRIFFEGGVSGASDTWYSEQRRMAPYLEDTPSTLSIGPGDVVAGLDAGLAVPQVFTDVPPDHVRFGHLAWLAASGVVTGYPDGTFRPDAAVTRAAMAAILHRFQGRPATPPDAPEFSDVPEGSPFHDAVSWLVASGFAEGYKNETFRPDKPLTRAAAADILYRLDGAPEVADAPPAFADVQPGDRHFTAIQWIAAEWIERPGDNFQPDELLTRSDLARILYFFRYRIVPVTVTPCC